MQNESKRKLLSTLKWKPLYVEKKSKKDNYIYKIYKLNNIN